MDDTRTKYSEYVQRVINRVQLLVKYPFAYTRVRQRRQRNTLSRRPR